jgi:hypothetical protein
MSALRSSETLEGFLFGNQLAALRKRVCDEFSDFGAGFLAPIYLLVAVELKTRIGI